MLLTSGTLESSKVGMKRFQCSQEAMKPSPDSSAAAKRVLIFLVCRLRSRSFTCNHAVCFSFSNCRASVAIGVA